MGEIVNCDLPLQFRESVTVRCDKIQSLVREKLHWSLDGVCKQIESFELEVGTELFQSVQTGLNLLGYQFMLEADLQTF